MRDLLLSKAPLTEHVQRIPQWKINAFPPEITCFDDNRRVNYRCTFGSMLSVANNVQKKYTGSNLTVFNTVKDS